MTTGNKNERIAYPQLADPISSEVLNEQYTPWRDEIAWAFEVTRTEKARLGLLVILKVFDALGRFIATKDIPSEIIRYVANRADLVKRDQLVYSKRTFVRHYRLIREFLGVREWGNNAREVAVKTMKQIAASRTQPADQINGTIEVLIQKRFELPALSTLRRMAGIVQQCINDVFFDVVAKNLTAVHRETLDALLEVPRDAKESPFAKLCRPPGRA